MELSKGLGSLEFLRFGFGGGFGGGGGVGFGFPGFGNFSPPTFRPSAAVKGGGRADVLPAALVLTRFNFLSSNRLFAFAFNKSIFFVFIFWSPVH